MKALPRVWRKEGAKRLSEHGPNRIPPPKRLLARFRNVSIYVLLGAGLAAALLEQLVDAGVNIGVVVINELIRLIQEGKAEKAIDAVHNMLSAPATVIPVDHNSWV